MPRVLVNIIRVVTQPEKAAHLFGIDVARVNLFKHENSQSSIHSLTHSRTSMNNQRRPTVETLFVGWGSNSFARSIRSLSSCDDGPSSSDSLSNAKTSHFMLTLALSETELTLFLKTEISGSWGDGELTIIIVGMVVMVVLTLWTFRVQGVR